MEELIKNVINKVRTMYKYDTLIKDIVSQRAEITLVENNGQLKISTITFDNYDYVVVSANKITYHPEIGGGSRTLISYDGFEQLLEM